MTASGLGCGGTSLGRSGAEGVWYMRWKLRTGDAVYRARIIAYMAGAEAETESLGAAEGGDDDDRFQIDLMAEQLDRCDLDRLRAMTRMLVRRHRHGFERVAAALLKKQKLSGRQIDKLAGRSIADVPDRLPSDFRESWPEDIPSLISLVEL
jgi:hypothetical protein